MKRRVWLAIFLLVLCCEVPLACWVILAAVDPTRIYSAPPATFQDSDLAGTWEDHYWGGEVDRLIIRPDGTFKQIYCNGDYRYETPWNKWWVERLPDGRVRVHLEGARYYLTWVERGDYLFHDPFGNESIKMINELVLNVRRLPSGEIILYHMFTSSEEGFPIIGFIGWETEMFRRVETP